MNHHEPKMSDIVNENSELNQRASMLANSGELRRMLFGKGNGGESGIRTHVRVSPKHAFQACAFNHSAISPEGGSLLNLSHGEGSSFACGNRPTFENEPFARENEIVYFCGRLIYISALFGPVIMARAQERGPSNAPHYSPRLASFRNGTFCFFAFGSVGMGTRRRDGLGLSRCCLG